MKPELNYGWTICCISIAVIFLSLFGLGVAQDQNPPYGMDKGVWVLTETKPDLVPEKDWENGANYNHHVEVSGNTATGGFSWKDVDCSGKVLGTSTWTAPPGVLVPGSKQETTLTAKIDGSQNCGYRFVSTSTSMSVGDNNLKPWATAGFATNDPNPGLQTVKLPWEVPWGKIGDKLNITIGVDPPGVRGSPWWAASGLIYYIYFYQADAPATSPSSLLPRLKKGTKEPEPREGKGPVRSSECPDSGVRFSNMWGQVEIRPHTNVDAWRTAEMDSKLCVDDHVKTFEDSGAILSFADLTTFVMKPETEIILDTPPQKDSRVTLKSGSLWENFKKMLKDGSMEVEMSQAVAGIKGTTFVCEETGTESTVKVLEGVVSFKSKATGDEILVNAGEMATATASGLSRLQSFDVEAEKASWEKYVPEDEPSTISAVTQKWDPRGNWKFNYYYGGNTYAHDMVIESFDQVTGAFNGYGQDSDDPSYTWDVSGTIDGDNIKFHIDFTGKDPDYWADAEGLMSSATYMSGNAKAPGQTATWDAVKTTPNTQKWDPRGNWKFNYYYSGKTYTHDMMIESFNSGTGEFKGLGRSLFEPSYAWTVAGKVDNNNIKFRIDYINGNGYYVDAKGVISSNTFMSGNAEAPPQIATWDAVRTGS